MGEIEISFVEYVMDESAVLAIVGLYENKMTVGMQ